MLTASAARPVQHGDHTEALSQVAEHDIRHVVEDAVRHVSEITRTRSLEPAG